MNILLSILILIKLKITWSGTVKTANKSSKFMGYIVGGVSVPIEKYPSSAIVYNQESFCGGNILSSWAVLTAAHCFDMDNDVSEITIHVGSKYRFGDKTKLYNVRDLKVHEDYNKALQFACDIAILFVDRPIAFNKRIQRAIIVDNDKWMDRKHKHFEIAGWGTLSYEGPVSNDGLMVASLTYVPMEECSKLHDTNFSEDIFCLYGKGKKDSCKGDSGSGVMWHGFLVGLVSHGEKCAEVNKPSMYANVYYFRKWISDSLEKYYKQNCTA